MKRAFHFEKEGLVDDLVYLRKGSGFRPARVYKATALVEAIGGEQQLFETIRARFISAIESLPDQQGAQALLAAYGLTEGYEGTGDLRIRREIYGETVNRKYDTLTDWENSAIDELAIRLLTAFYAGAPVSAELPMPHGGFLMESMTVQTLIRERRFVEHVQGRKILSLVDGAKGFAYHSNAMSRLILIDGTRIDTKYVSGGALHTCYFPHPLNRGQTHKFSFREVVDEENRDEKELTKNIDYAGQIQTTPTLIYRQSVRFEGELPAVIWCYDKLSFTERPGEPDEKNTLQADASGLVLADFTQQYGGLCSGIAWRWG